MRHATQARFDRVAQGGLKNPSAYRLVEMINWTETDWNWHMRKALEAQGFRTFHIREASETGVADLVVYQVRPAYVHREEGNTALSAVDLQVIDAWLELKKANDLSEIRSSQKEFMREHWRAGHNAMFVMFDRKVGMLAVRQGDLKGRVKMYLPCPYNVSWADIFAHFKARK